MSFHTRIPLIKRIEELRGSHVICYLTCLRQNLPSLMAEDAIRIFFDHLLKLPVRRLKNLDIFLVSNGGNSPVPWRLVALFREYAERFSVLIPYRAYSAATLLALGADEIVMHPFAELGPIDPSVSNDFNPTEPGGRRLAINVEDVKAYVDFIKSTVGITHEDELIKAIEALVSKVHPLAIGNVERFLSQSRMIARKIMKTHTIPADEHLIDEIVENLASKLYFHGHPINRVEAKSDLRLKVLEDLPSELETTMWDLYKDFEVDFKNQETHNPLGDVLALLAQGPPAKVSEPQEARIEMDLLHVVIESNRLSSAFKTRRRYSYFQNLTAGQSLLHEEIVSQAWSHFPDAGDRSDTPPTM